MSSMNITFQRHAGKQIKGDMSVNFYGMVFFDITYAMNALKHVISTDLYTVSYNVYSSR